MVLRRVYHWKSEILSHSKNEFFIQGMKKKLYINIDLFLDGYYISSSGFLY